MMRLCVVGILVLVVLPHFDDVVAIIGNALV